MYALTEEYPADNSFTIEWDTMNFTFNQNGIRLTEAYFVSEFGYIGGIDNKMYSLSYTQIDDGDTVTEFSTNYFELYPFDSLPDCSNGKWVIKLNLYVFFNFYPVGIYEQIVDKRIFIGPNPVDNSVTIYNRTDLNALNLDFFNINGALVYSTVIDAKLNSNFDVSFIPSGIYFIHFSNSNNSLISIHKIVKL